MAPQLSILIRWSLITALLLLIITVAMEVISSPTVITTAGVQAPVYLILFVLALLIYGWFTLFRTRVATRAAQVALQTNRKTPSRLLCNGSRAWC